MAEASMVLDSSQSWEALDRLGDWMSDHATLADNGRWDSRARPIHHVESALAVRAALAALTRTAKRRDPLDPSVIGWTDAVRSLDAWLGAEGRFGVGASSGWRREGSAVVEGDQRSAEAAAAATHADDTSDASLLRWLADRAPSLPGDVEHEADERRVTSIDQTLAQLGEGPFVHRHLPHVDDGFPPGQGADLWASFTMVSALCSIGRWEAAHDRMESLSSALGPTHIGATHVDPIRRDLRGNLLAAPVHLALIAAALALNDGPR